jgi:predicted metal-dependent enzyme (double-stranded beta helix superfamily)
MIAGAAGLAAAADAQARQTAARFDLDRFVEEVRLARRESDSQAAVEAVLARALSAPGQVLTALGEPTAVGVREIHRAPDLTILNVIWGPSMIIMPHDHRMWATIGVYSGREDNIFWERHGQTVQATRAASIGDREVLSLPSDAVHSVANPLRRLTCAIHIYGGDFFGAQRSEWDPETLRERPMDFQGVLELFEEANERFNATQH